MSHDKRYGILEIAVAALIMSFSGPFTRWAGLPSGAMAFVRTAVPSLVLGIWLTVRRRKGRDTSATGGIGTSRRRTIPWLILASTLNAVRMLMFFEAFRLTSLGNAIIVLYSWPVFALLFGSLLLGERLNGRDVLLLGSAFLGMVVVYSGSEFSLDDRDFLGMSLMLGSAAFYALMIVLIRRENIERLRATFWQNLVGPVVFFPAFLRTLGSVPSQSWGWAGMNGLLVGTLAFSLFFSAFRKIPAAVVGHISYLEVVFVIVWGFFIFSEPVGWRHLVGGGLIVASMMVRAEWARRAASG